MKFNKKIYKAFVVLIIINDRKNVFLKQANSIIPLKTISLVKV